MTFPHVAPAAVDVALAVRRRVAGISAITSRLGPPTLSLSSDLWLFTRHLQAIPEQTGAAAAVLAIEGPWARPNRHNTARFPRLALNIYADCSRSPEGASIRQDADPRARWVWEAFNDELDRKNHFSEIWGAEGSDPGLRVWGSHMLGEPDIFDIPDWKDGVRLQCHYALSVG